uniref:Uncharacterized protein n=1 Tax=Arundo donax TaxID=35708 RepID=A0A0A9FX47_ARUDO
MLPFLQRSRSRTLRHRENVFFFRPTGQQSAFQT